MNQWSTVFYCLQTYPFTSVYKCILVLIILLAVTAVVACFVIESVMTFVVASSM